MSSDEQEREIGKAFVERNAAQRELACLERKRDRFIGDVQSNLRMWMDHGRDMSKGEGHSLHVMDGKTVEWLNDDDIVYLAGRVRELKAKIKELSTYLDKM